MTELLIAQAQRQSFNHVAALGLALVRKGLITAIITPVTTALILAGCAASGVLDALWLAPTTNVDGSPLTDVVSYRVYFSTVDAPCTRGRSVGVAPSPAPAPGRPIVFRLTGLTIGQLYYVAVAAVTSGGIESECSITKSARARLP